ncbi:MAG: phosphate ABC transporter substrate-binding protein, partial [Planctomycetaceae bacterium]|nr:phosphate ABC transporter substrate-binding protein [Planctomycetaceae bacterium]
GLFIAGCGSSEEMQTITLTGSSTIAPLAAELGKRFEEQNPGYRVDVQTGGSSRGVAEAKTHQADIGMVSRALSEDEKEFLSDHPIARDGICLIVHQTNPVSELTDEQIVKIYTGEITNWQEVGGPDSEIVVVHKAEGRSTLELFLKHFGLKNEQVEADSIIGDNQQGIKLVSQRPEAIGYVSIGTAQYEAENGVTIKLLPVGGVEATVENVANETFPLSRTLNLVTAKDADLSPATKKFLEFAQSAEVHDVVEGQQFVPLRK